jgi:hypothetical protein
MIRLAVSCALAGLLMAVPGAILVQAIAINATDDRWTLTYTVLLFTP